MDSRIWRWGLAAVLAVPVAANAALVDRGEGLIYDSTLDITWLQDANYAKTQYTTTGGAQGDRYGPMTWTAATAWVAGLSYSTISYGTLTDWRLPTMVDTGASGQQCSTYSGTDCGYNVQTTDDSTVYSEMASLYYDTLGNLAYYNTSGSGPQAGWGLSNTGPFTNVQSNYYWSGLEYAPDTSLAWNFHFYNGNQGVPPKSNEFFAWAVHPGDVAPVPVPAAVWLFGSAVMGLVGLGRRARH